MAKTRQFILATARRATRNFAGSFSDLEDYVQIGEIALWTAARRWTPGKGSFRRFVQGAIRHEIMNAAIRTHFPVSAPLKAKRLAMQVAAMRSQGMSDQEIMSQTGIDQSRLVQFQRMSSPVRRAREYA